MQGERCPAIRHHAARPNLAIVRGNRTAHHELDREVSVIRHCRSPSYPPPQTQTIGPFTRAYGSPHVRAFRVFRGSSLPFSLLCAKGVANNGGSSSPHVRAFRVFRGSYLPIGLPSAKGVANDSGRGSPHFRVFRGSSLPIGLLCAIAVANGSGGGASASQRRFHDPHIGGTR